MNSTVKIYLANARLDDPIAMQKILAPLHDADNVAKSLARGAPSYGVSYNVENRTAYYVVCDGELVSCFSVVGISNVEASAISHACGDSTDWRFLTFQAIVARTLDGTAARYN